MNQYILIIFIASLIIYIFFGYCQFKLAQKTNTDHAWAAFIPILSLVQLIQISNRKVWEIFLFLIPGINLIMAILLFHSLSNRLGKGVLMTIALIFLYPFVFPYLCLSYKGESAIQKDVPPLSTENLPPEVAENTNIQAGLDSSINTNPIPNDNFSVFPQEQKEEDGIAGPSPIQAENAAPTIVIEQEANISSVTPQSTESTPPPVTIVSPSSIASGTDQLASSESPITPSTNPDTQPPQA